MFRTLERQSNGFPWTCRRTVCASNSTIRSVRNHLLPDECLVLLISVHPFSNAVNCRVDFRDNTQQLQQSIGMLYCNHYSILETVLLYINISKDDLKRTGTRFLLKSYTQTAFKTLERRFLNRPWKQFDDIVIIYPHE